MTPGNFIEWCCKQWGEAAISLCCTQHAHPGKEVLRQPCCVDVHVGEAALALARNVDYEVPFLTRQAARVQQQLADLERKHTEHLRSAVQATREYCQASCDSLPHQKRPCPT